MAERSAPALATDHLSAGSTLGHMLLLQATIGRSEVYQQTLPPIPVRASVSSLLASWTAAVEVSTTVTECVL